MFTCPMCDGSPVLLGELGVLVWFRCRNCGWTYSVDKAEVEELERELEEGEE